MRLDFLRGLGLAVLLPAVMPLTGSCGAPTGLTNGVDGSAPRLEGDAALISAAQQVSDAVGGCPAGQDQTGASKVVGLETGAIVMIACGQNAGADVYRIFSVHAGGPPRLLAFPDYNAEGWLATTEAAMAELDAGTGVLSTFRRDSDQVGCGSEGEYEWNGDRFVIRELRWQACTTDSTGSPFPIIWPTQQGSATAADTATPAP